MTRLLVVFALALVVRLGYVGLGHDEASLMQPDSAGYLALAESLADGAGFGRDEGDGWRPETKRLPGYPAWLALFRIGFGDDPIAPVLGQAVVDAFTCVLIALLAARLDPRLGLAAGLLAALNLTMITSAGYVLADSLFLFLFTGWLVAALDHMAAPTARRAILAGALLGLATLLRPMTQFVPVLFALVVVAAALRAGARPGRAALHGALALGVGLALLAPVALRNHALYGHLALTSQGGSHALGWVAPAALEFGAGVPFDDGRRLMAELYARAYPMPLRDPFAASDQAAAVARAALGELGVVGLARAWLSGAALNLAVPSAAAVPMFRRLDRPSFYATPGDGAFDKAINAVRSTDDPTALVVLGLGAAAMVAIRLVQFVGLARVGRRLLSLPWLFLLGVALYVLVVTGPVTGVKYRLPLEPLLMVLFALGLVGRRPRPARAESEAPPATTPPTARS